MTIRTSTTLKSGFTLLIILCFTAMHSLAQKTDTLQIKPSDLQLAYLRPSNNTYIVYTTRGKDKPAGRITLVKIKVEAKTQEQTPVFTITQQWDADTVVHTAYTVLHAKNLSTLLHETWWKRLGYTARFDFASKQTSFTGSLADSLKQQITNDFTESFNAFNLNWHSDLLLFPVLPFKEKRVFKINFYDPGFGKAKYVFYSVAGSDVLTDHSGKKVSCWVLEHTSLAPNGAKALQKFWIAKETREVLKEEDSFPNGGYRIKLKMSVSENE